MRGMPPPPARSAPARGLLLVAVGVVLVAANLRPTVTSVAPLLTQIRLDLGLSSATAALLTATPVLCFGLLAPFAPRIADRLGIERTLGLVLLAIAACLAIRIGPDSLALFAGTILAGGAIALGNVLLPALTKRDFPTRAGPLTGPYTMALQVSAAVAAGLSVPVAAALDGWRAGLGIWAVPVVITLLVWLPRRRRRALAPRGGAPR